MAEKATIYKTNLTLSDMDRNVYDSFNLTIALHPSETLERMMVRILAFCYCAAEHLTFAKGLSATEEPDLWLRHDNGTLLEWIEVGQPTPERLKKPPAKPSPSKYSVTVAAWISGGKIMPLRFVCYQKFVFIRSRQKNFRRCSHSSIRL